MRSTSVRSLVLLLAVAVPFAAGSPAGGPRSGAYVRGPASGDWELPGFGDNGFVAGTLDSVDGGAAIYAFVGELLDRGAACPACFVGSVEGTLDDGRGPGPDYLVEGDYVGDFPSGEGSFVAQVRRPGGVVVGTIAGRLEDSALGGVGSFHGRWRLRP